MTEWRKTKKYNPSGPGYPEAGEYYVLKSEAEEKIEAAEAKLRVANAEIERQQGLVRNYLETIEGNEIDISGLLEKLRAVGELPEKWRRWAANMRGITAANRIRDCADELEALLKEGA